LWSRGLRLGGRGEATERTIEAASREEDVANRCPLRASAGAFGPEGPNRHVVELKAAPERFGRLGAVLAGDPHQDLARHVATVAMEVALHRLGQLIQRESVRDVRPAVAE